MTALARRLTDAGHPTVTPDLYAGQSTEDVEAGFRIHHAIGAPELMERARLAPLDLPDYAVLAGISMGVGITGHLWAERPDAAGVIFLSGPGPWPDDRSAEGRVQMHMARPDPFDSEEYVAEWIASADGRPLEVFRYGGVGHNFLDEGGPDWDAGAAALCEERLLAFLDGLRIER